MHRAPVPRQKAGSQGSLPAWDTKLHTACRAKGLPGLYQGFSMGLASSCAGAGVGFATYEALTVAYRQRRGYAPTPTERGAIAGAAWAVTVTSDCFDAPEPRPYSCAEGGHAS